MRLPQPTSLSEAFPTTSPSDPRYRAVYWRADNRTSGGIQLTGRDHQSLPDDRLLAAAHRNATSSSISLAGGKLLILGPAQPRAITR
jgi:hypothetical protein